VIQEHATDLIPRLSLQNIDIFSNIFTSVSLLGGKLDNSLTERFLAQARHCYTKLSESFIAVALQRLA